MYSHIAPFSFDLPQAYVGGGQLGPEGPAYKALVIPNNQGLTPNNVKHLQSYAESGLLIILAGDRPKSRPTGSTCTEQSLDSALDKLRRTRNVYTVQRGQVAAHLAKMGLRPRASMDVDVDIAVDASSPDSRPVVYTTWREDSENGLHYAFIYNSAGQPVSGDATFASEGVPSVLDAWTGKTRRVFTYAQNNQSTSIPVQLNAGQTIIFGFDGKPHEQETRPVCHFTSLSSHVLGVTQAQGHQHWETPSKEAIYDGETVASKRNTTHQRRVLISWLDIPNLTNASGNGYYTTEFSWSGFDAGQGHRLGAYLRFSNITHILQLYINDQAIEPFDHSAGLADISSYLVDGKNEVLVIVPTTMWNYISSIAGDVRESGNVPTGLELFLDNPLALPRVDSGLVGDVDVVPRGGSG
ncbi:uncharacterized protein BDV17DRAFT_290549 [Aspergillus undulatus]|uniref:uncharacterized protein n=1 Tax=Aspergillus undulatus TaxID=1810928 RepID=UPI003CCD8DE6